MPAIAYLHFWHGVCICGGTWQNRQNNRIMERKKTTRNKQTKPVPRTPEEVSYLMGYHGIEKFPIFEEMCFGTDGRFRVKGYHMGNIMRDRQTGKLRYEKGLHKYFKEDGYAIEASVKQIDAYIKAMGMLTSKDTREVSVVEYSDYKPTQTLGETGTFDEIFERVERANNRLRYCNGSYFRYADDDVASLERLWQKTIYESRSFAMYYGGGIVD